MSGVGRRTLYRKSVTEEYLNSTPEPAENEEISLVQAPRGSNIIEIKLATGEQALAILPTRFRKLIWVKRGDYLITSTSAGDFETNAGETGKVRHRVEHILSKDHIKHLKTRGLWPAAFGEAAPTARSVPGSLTEGCRDDASASASRREGHASAGSGENGAGVTAKAGTIDAADGFDAVDPGVSESLERRQKAVEDEEGQDTGEEGEEEEEDDMSDLFVNNNRTAMMRLRIDHGDDEEDSELDSEDEDD